MATGDTQWTKDEDMTREVLLALEAIEESYQFQKIGFCEWMKNNKIRKKAEVPY